MEGMNHIAEHIRTFQLFSFHFSGPIEAASAPTGLNANTRAVNSGLLDRMKRIHENKTCCDEHDD